MDLRTKGRCDECFFESGFPWGHQMAVPDCAKNGADFEDLEVVE
jgi:hypothetical protein